MDWKYFWIVLAVVVVVIAVIWLLRVEKFNNFAELKKLIPEDAINCPHMATMGINLADEEYMKDNWKIVRNAVESGYMPPAGFDDIWTEDQKQKFLRKLTEWGKKQA